MNNDKFIYKEYDNLNGRFEERYNITKVFDNIEDLMKFIDERKSFYLSYWNTRRIEIDIIKENK